MGRIIKSVLAATIIAASAIGGAVPASANQVSLNLSPANADQQRMMQLGLGMYALVQNIENGSITQRGSNNSAGLSQGGWGNLGIVHQDGRNHNGTVTQQGGNNSYGLFQFGQGTNAHVNQNGNQSGLGFVFGW